MAVADILSGIGKGLATAGRAAVPVLERTAEVVSGEAPQIDEEISFDFEAKTIELMESPMKKPGTEYDILGSFKLKEEGDGQ